LDGVYFRAADDLDNILKTLSIDQLAPLLGRKVLRNNEYQTLKSLKTA